MLFLYWSLLLFLLLQRNIKNEIYVIIVIIITYFTFGSVENLIKDMVFDNYYIEYLYHYSIVFFSILLITLKYRLDFVFLDNRNLDNENTKLITLSNEIENNNKELIKQNILLKKEIFEQEEDISNIQFFLDNISRFNKIELIESIKEIYKKILKMDNIKFKHNIKNIQIDKDQYIVWGFDQDIIGDINIVFHIDNEIGGFLEVSDFPITLLTKRKILLIKNLAETISLQLNRISIYEKQKETAVTYADKDIYNIRFLKKVISQEIQKSKRYGTFSLLLSFNVKNIDFNEIETTFKKYFREEDYLFFDHINKKFSIFCPQTPKEQSNAILSKLESIDITNVSIKTIDKDFLWKE